MSQMNAVGVRTQFWLISMESHLEHQHKAVLQLGLFLSFTTLLFVMIQNYWNWTNWFIQCENKEIKATISFFSLHAGTSSIKIFIHYTRLFTCQVRCRLHNQNGKWKGMWIAMVLLTYYYHFYFFLANNVTIIMISLPLETHNSTFHSFHAILFLKGKKRAQLNLIKMPFFTFLLLASTWNSNSITRNSEQTEESHSPSFLQRSSKPNAKLTKKQRSVTWRCMPLFFSAKPTLPFCLPSSFSFLYSHTPTFFSPSSVLSHSAR